MRSIGLPGKRRSALSPRASAVRSTPWRGSLTSACGASDVAASSAALANQIHADAFVTISADTLNGPSFSGSVPFYGKSGGFADMPSAPAETGFMANPPE